MTEEQAKSDRKPRARISADQHLLHLHNAKKAEVAKLHERAKRLHGEWQVANKALEAAQADLKRYDAALPKVELGEAAQ